MTKDYSKQPTVFTYGNILAGSILLLGLGQFTYENGIVKGVAALIIVAVVFWLGHRTGKNRGEYDGYWERHRQEQEAIAKYDSPAPGHSEGIAVPGMGKVVSAASKRADHAISIWGGDVKPDGTHVEDGNTGNSEHPCIVDFRNQSPSSSPIKWSTATVQCKKCSVWFYNGVGDSKCAKTIQSPNRRRNNRRRNNRRRNNRRRNNRKPKQP